MPTSQQIRAARALLEWLPARLATEAGVSIGTIRNAEHGSGPPAVQVTTLIKIRDALAKAGIEFLNDEGVRLRRR